MSIESEVAALTSATTDLLSAVNISKATLDGAVDDATDQAAIATGATSDTLFITSLYFGAL